MTDDISPLVIYLIDKHDLKFRVNQELAVRLLAGEGFPHILVGRYTINSINSLLLYINNYIIYKGCDLYPFSSDQGKQSKYLNLLNLAGEPCYLNLSGVVSSANGAYLNKIKYLDKLNLLDAKLANRKPNSAPHIEISISKFNKNNESQESSGDAETARLQNEVLAEANTEANASSKLTIMLTQPDSQESIKEALKVEQKKRNLRSKKVVEHLKTRVQEYNESMDLASYFPRDWFTKNLNSVYRMRKIIDPDFIVKAIDWFFEDRWWRGKITDIYQVEKHYNKYIAAQKGKQSTGGMISQRLKELEINGK